MSNHIIKYTKDRLPSESFACDEACKVQNKRLDRLEGLLGTDRACRKVATKLNIKLDIEMKS
ncbi:MAG: hypothetical protein IJU76_07635 [Desulfovibrionaceae bacterium]|nr:hypothetical protein [Desulfovibrionaceae bacterium]